MPENSLNIKTLENWLWEASCKIRGEVDAPKYKDYILPLIFLKRLSDVFHDEILMLQGNTKEDEIADLSKDFADKDIIEQSLPEDHSVVRFYLPPETRWESIIQNTTNIAEHLTNSVRSIAGKNPKLQGVIDIVDFSATVAGQRVVSDDKLKTLMNILGRYRLGLKDVEPDILGRAYEYLLRKFAEGSGQSAGEFYTPREVAILMAHILNPEPDNEVYDPCCGSGGLLIKCYLKLQEKYHGDPSILPLRFYGQEILPSTFAMARMNSFIHDMDTQIALGDAMSSPAFTDKDGSIKKFDIVTANPMWNQDFPKTTYENDSYSRFYFGHPPSNSGDWGWIQHMFVSLKDKGRMAVVLDTGVVSRGSGNLGKNRERDIRKEFVDQDFMEAVILLPENLFYNTTAAGIILVINKDKRKKDEILLINGSKLFKKGRPKNYLTDETIKQISEYYIHWREKEGISKIITREEAVKNDYNLSPSRYVAQSGEDDTIPLEDALLLLKEAEEEMDDADRKLKSMLKELGIEL